MRSLVLLVVTTVLFLAPVCPAAEPAKAALAAYIHRVVLEKLPPKFEDRSEWGATIPAPPVVRFPRLQRTVLEVGGRYVVPHGTWKRTTVWMNDPARDLSIRVPEIRKVGKQTTRLRVEATASVLAQRERKQWARGVQLVGVTADADAVVAVNVDVDATIAFDPKRPLSGMKFAVKIAQVRIDLKAFELRRVGPVLLPEHSSLGEELKGKIQADLRALEPKIKDHANRLIGEGAVDGKGLLSAVGTR